MVTSHFTEMAEIIAIRDYDFDLSDQGFIDHLTKFGLSHHTGCGARLEFTQDHHATEAQFREQFNKSVTGYVFPDEDMDTHWKIMLIAKGVLQLAWQDYWGW